MHLPITLLSLALSCLPPTLATFADDAYDTDYHHALVGLPQPHTTFFHRPRNDDKASLLYTLSDQGVLGAINPGTGAIVWRQFLAANTNRTFGGANGIQGFLRAAEGRGAVVSAVGGYVNAWDSLTGREKWYNQFEGWARDLEILETVGREAEKDVLLLSEETGKGTLRRLNGATGDVVWQFAIESGDVPFQVSTNVKSVFVVSFHGSRGGYNLKVTTVDPVTGKRVEEHTLATKADIRGPEDVQFVGANMASPIVAWTDKTIKALKVNILGTKTVHTLDLGAAGEDLVKVVVHAPHLIQSQPHFLVHSQSSTAHWAEVYHVDIVAGTIAQAYHLPKLSGKGAFSTSSQDANVYFTRHSDDEVSIFSSASHGILGRFPVKAESGTGSAIHGVSEVVSKSSTTYAVRSAIVTTEDNWTLIRNGAPGWTRPEGLSGGVAAAWAEIPDGENLAEALEVEAHSSPVAAYIHRVTRHIDELKYLPGYFQALPMRFISSLLSSNATVANNGALVRDNFGFHKLVIVATERGRVYALDTINQGSIVWSIKAYDIPSGKKWDVKGIFVDKTKGVTTIRGSNGEYIIIKTIDGREVGITNRGPSPSVQASALVDSSSGKWLLPIGLGGEIELVPKELTPKDGLVVLGKNGEVKGLKYEVGGHKAVPSVVWTFHPTSGQRVLSVTARPLHDPVASIGRALSDRSVMYKYLNPNLILITTISDKAAVASFYLLDSISGEVLYSTAHEGVDPTQPITSVLTENWFAYSFWGDLAQDSPLTSSKGYQLVVSEMFESSLANDRGPLGSSANFSSVEPSEEPFDNPALPYMVTQSFLISEPINQLAITQTRQGITTRQLLCTLGASNAIIGIPRNLLEPRRPVGRDAKPGELEEGLIKYHPVIEFDPRMIITHKREVVGIKNIITSPALVESTSLVFAYGVDIFGTRVTPSLAFDILGKEFNRVALVATVVALAVGVGFLAPMVRRKQINGRWQS